jgi:hypothetical protein
MFARLCSLAVLSLALTASAATYYVATTGSNASAGTSTNAPWQTVSFAASNSNVRPGDTVYVRGGVYNEAVTLNISGSKAGGYITFASYPGETAVLDGSTLKVPAADNGLILIIGQHDLAFQGFELRNYRTNDNTGKYVPAGIWISGASYDIAIVSNRIHDIGVTNTLAKGNAYAMEVWGDSATQTITNVYVHGNEIYNMQTGQSETLSLDGNVSDFEISGNLIHDDNNIAIGFIGYEGVCPTASLDYARNGVCRSNTVWNISGINNAGEGKSYDADGIYSDGGSNVLVELNLVHNCDIGVEFASEHSGHAAIACVCRDNVIWSNNCQGISIGGYSTSVGQTWNCTITHNTLYHNDTQAGGFGELLVQYDALTNVFKDNILVATPQNIMIGSSMPSSGSNTTIADYNVYYAPGGASGATWEWNKSTYTGLAAYQGATHGDSNSIFADPLFINPNNNNFHLATNSPAINSGEPGFQPLSRYPGETDIDLQPRVALGRTDIGADELNLLSPTLAITLLAPGLRGLQLTGEPGHPFVWQQSGALPGGWLPLVTNAAVSSYWGPQTLVITDSDPLAMQFFRAQMVQ